MGTGQDMGGIGAAAFDSKYYDVSKRLKDLHVEVEMFRVLAGNEYLLDKAATLAEVEQYVKAALAALRESDERRAIGQGLDFQTDEASGTVVRD